MDTKPTASGLQSELEDLVRWQEFAVFLPNMNFAIISTIERDYPKDNETAKRKMLEKWLSIYDNATWSSVEKALIRAKEIALASRIGRYASSLSAAPTTTASTNTQTQNVVTNEATGQRQTQPTSGHTQNEAAARTSTGQD